MSRLLGATFAHLAGFSRLSLLNLDAPGRRNGDAFVYVDDGLAALERFHLRDPGRDVVGDAAGERAALLAALAEWSDAGSAPGGVRQ